MTNIQTVQLAKSYLNKLSLSDRMFLLKLLVSETTTLFEERVWLIEVPRDIRNKLNLWALYSKDEHPDDLSALIAEEVKKELLK